VVAAAVAVVAAAAAAAAAAPRVLRMSVNDRPRTRWPGAADL